MSKLIRQTAYNLSLESRFYGDLFAGVQIIEKPGPSYWDFTPSGEWILNTDPNASPDFIILKVLLQDLIQFVYQSITGLPKSFPDQFSLSSAFRKWNFWTYSERQLFKRRSINRLLPLLPKLLQEEEVQLEAKGFRQKIVQQQVLPTNLNWSSILRQFVSAGLQTEVVNTFHRISRRYGNYPGMKIRRKPKIGLAIDRSGSISPELNSLFWAEIQRIHRLQASLVICEFDHRIQRISSFHPNKLYQAKAGGGTDFNPPLSWANDADLQGLIIFTDGFAPAPLVKPLIPCLWIVCSDVGTQFPGKQIQLKIK